MPSSPPASPATRRFTPEGSRSASSCSRSGDAATNTTSETALRTADVYVFALHAHQDKRTADPLDVLQWEFFVLPAAVLNERCALQKTIGLGSLLKLGPTRVGFSELGETIGGAV